METETKAKAGFRTSEFWMALLPILLQILAAFGIVDVANQDAMNMATIGGIGYGGARAVTKMRAQKQVTVVESE